MANGDLFFYIVHLDGQRYKIGKTNDIDRRMREHRNSCPYARVIAQWPCTDEQERGAIAHMAAPKPWHREKEAETFVVTDLSDFIDTLRSYFNATTLVDPVTPDAALYMGMDDEPVREVLAHTMARQQQPYADTPVNMLPLPGAPKPVSRPRRTVTLETSAFKQAHAAALAAFPPGPVRCSVATHGNGRHDMRNAQHVDTCIMRSGNLVCYTCWRNKYSKGGR